MRLPSFAWLTVLLLASCGDSPKGVAGSSGTGAGGDAGAGGAGDGAGMGGAGGSGSTAPWIAFASNREGNYEIYVVRADGADLRRPIRIPQD